MKMKQLLKYTSSLLRIVLLLGALTLFNNQPTLAQTVGLPDAFETMDPATIIGDGNYYYIQFYNGTSIRSYLTDCGVNQIARAQDFLPYANNRLWTLEAAGDATHFKLKNKDGHYLYFETGGSARVRCVDNSTSASILTFFSLGDGYDISVANDVYPMYRNNNAEWTDLICNVTRRSSYYDWTRLRFVKLKSNSAFIIYYRGEAKGDVGNTDPTLATTRHYLTYSGTASSSLGNNWWSSDVSSQQSIIPADKPLCSLPTVAAYHKDGLWTLEKADEEGRFYIKKYGTEQYLNEHNHSGVYDCALESKDATKGTYTLEDPLANRYTRIQNTNNVTEPLTANMFFEWNGYGANETKTSDTPTHVDVYFGNNTQLSAGSTVYGDGWHVNYLKYADLTGYKKILVEGTPYMQLRFLMDRVEPIASDQPGYDADGGAFVEKNVTIGSDGKAEVDLTNLELNTTTTASATVKMTYVNYNEANTSYGDIAAGNPAYCGYNKISSTSSNSIVNLAMESYGVNNIAYLQVDASDLSGTITRVTLKGDFQQFTDRALQYGVGYNNSDWSSTMTWNSADRSITLLGDPQYVAKTTNDDTELSFDITDAFTDSKVKTILVYNLAAGAGYIKNPRVEVEYYPSVSYAHLNSIKVGNGSGIVTSITLEKTNEHRYLHHADGDGWQVLQWSGEDTNNNWWYAGFYPVEVVQTDEYYQVSLKYGNQMVGVGSNQTATLKTYNDFNPELWELEQLDDYAHFRFRSWNGLYYDGIGNSLTATAPTGTDRGIYKNTDINSMFTVTWLPKTETRIMHDVTHKVSNVRLYYTYNPTSEAQQKVYSQQGLITNDISEWRNNDGTQKVNEFKITHYVKKGDVVTYGLPTVLTNNNDHRLFQRWYKYGDDTNLNDLKDHFRLKVNDVEVMSYLYNNGIVTGERLDWGTIFPGARTYELNYLTYNNSDGQAFTLAADVSRYSDFTYKNSTSHLDGDLEEPSLTMRYIYYMKDAKEMANDLMACTGNTWLEEKTYHFPAKTVSYEGSKSAAYQGEFIGIKHLFRDYWVFSGGTGDENLISAVTSNTEGYINVVVEPGNTGITKGGKDNKGYYLYDEGKNGGGKSYGDSRFAAFKYPNSGEVSATGEANPAYVKVYFTYGGVNYQIAKFTIIFDAGTATLPWTSVNGSAQVKGSDRDPKELGQKAGDPIAKITFDFPTGQTFKNCSKYYVHNNGVYDNYEWEPIANSSPLPLTFDNTNYGFDGDNPSWGSYALVTTMPTRYGNNQTTLPVDHETYGYNKSPDAGMQSAFLYIDASEQPGDICSIPFVGEFCSNDLLMCTGWISGSNKVTNDDRCPGSVTLTVKGERTENGVKVTDNIYRFCPGQCYELDNGTGVDGGTGADHVVWQQFYFEFNISTHYERQWVEVNNNCVSSTGGDFMLDNIEVYAMAPKVEPEMNTPLCVNSTASEMQLLKMTVGFDKLVVASGVNTSSTNYDHSFGMVFLKKDVFLKTFQSGLSTYNSITISLSELEKNIKDGVYKDITTTYKSAYEAAFDAALLGSKDIWNSNSTNPTVGAGLLNYHWSHRFEDQETYSFVKAVNGLKPIFGYTDPETGERSLVMNGNSPKLPWELNTVYYIVTNNSGISNVSDRFSTFNICSDCTKENVFQLTPPYKILSMETSNMTQELEVCEGKIPTLLTDLRGYNYNGVEVPLTNLNFDWWLGDLSANPKVPATLENYHNQKKTIDGVEVRLDMALSYLRVYYPGITSLDGIIAHTSQTPNLTVPMIKYLQELVDKGQLVLHQKSVSFPVVKVSDDDPYFYLVACPIHDGYFDQALNHNKANDVAYFCEEPQGLRMKVGEKAPTLKTGFVPGENGFDSYAYPTDSDPLLSIRLAKKAQFETVRHGTVSDNPADTYNTTAPADKHFLWLPIRDAKVQSSGSTKASRSDDYNIYLASTNDPVWDQEIYTEMSKAVSSLPIVGKIVQLNAINTGVSGNVAQQNSQNRLCIYFTTNFEVREGYSYTLSLPFKEDGTNTCDGTILINMKIVPDYEVWTGAAGNTDWNNDENWRRADGNTTNNNGLNGDELYVGAATASSPLKGYTTNADNYRSAKDRVFRKGFAPLYCTHVLIKSDEWGNAPVLYDALDGKNSLTASPFPNLRDEDNWNGQGAEASATPILRYDMQARLYDIWSETYGSAPASNKGRSGDLLAEMYQVNSCDEIVFQPGTELMNAHLLNYNSAWVEYKLDNKRWYLLGSPLQGTISGEWYAPKSTAQQKTTYYDPVSFGAGYDRYNPAIYQRSWDKAKAVLYEIGSSYATTDDSQTDNLGTGNEGKWSNNTSSAEWQVEGGGTADEYLDRLGYKPMGGNKANVAIQGIWSNTYNDATVDYANGGFSVMVMNHLKGTANDQSNDITIVRLPKEDTMYDYYQFSQTGANDGGTDTELSVVRDVKDRAKNRGRLKTDLLLPTSTNKTEKADSRYGDKRTYTRIPIKEGDLNTMLTGIRNHEETISAGVSNLGYYLVENPFPCGLDMNKFFAINTGLEKKYWLLTATGQHLVQQAEDGDWISPTTADDFVAATSVLVPGQGFFVQATTPGQATTITFTKDMQAKSRYGEQSGTGKTYNIVVGTKQKMTTTTETITMDDGSTQTVTVEVPETDASGNYVLEDLTEDVVVYNYEQTSETDKQYKLKTRGETAEALLSGMVITAEREDFESSALVMQRGTASNDFLPEEDTETFITSDLQHVPTVYTLCGRLATTINSIHDFRSLSLGVESNSDAPCTLTFKGVEMLGDSIAFYDAVEKTLTPLESGMQVSVSGQTQNRYYLVRGLNLKEAAEETHLQIFTEGLTAKVIASTAEPILVVRCFDTSGRLLYTANPDSAEHSFTLPGKGIYIIEAQTENDRKTKKVMTK